MPGPPSVDLPRDNAIEKRLLVVAEILDKAVAAVNQAISDIRASEEGPGQEGRTADDI